MTAPADTRPKNIDALDGLRGLACLLVVMQHADWIGAIRLYYSAGHFAVMLFLALSGFLMAHHYLPAPLSGRYWLAFLVRRFFRIYPLYALVVIALWCAYPAIDISYFERFNTALTLKGLLLYENGSILWTVPVEMKFYAVFALLGLWFATRFCKWDLLLLAILWLTLVTAALPNAALPGTGLHFLANFDKKTLWPYLSYCLSGVIAARLYRTQAAQSLPPLFWNVLAALCLAFIAAISAKWLHPENYLPSRIWPEPMFFSAMTLLTVLSFAKATAPVACLLANRPMRFLGDISYSLYLTHFYLFVAGHYIYMPPYARYVTMMSSAIAFAWVTYRFIEKPCHKYGITLSNAIMKLP